MKITDLLKARLKLFLGKGVHVSYSQFGEDLIAQTVLKEKTGVYVDVGAYHPTLYSNTYGLYMRGWRGVAIDPNPAMSALYKALRPQDVFVCAAVGTKGIGTYHSFSDGAYNTLDEKEAEIRKNLPRLTHLGSTEIPFKPLAQILQEQRMSRIDFLNIDVEGKDLEVLMSHDWSLPPKVIAVETHSFNPDVPEQNPIYTFLRSKGYSLIGFSGLTLVWQRSNFR